MKKQYVIPKIEIINIGSYDVLSASGLLGVNHQPGDQKIDGSSLFG